MRAITDADYKEFFNTLERSHDITLFAPCDAAWRDDYTLNSIISNKNKFKDILRMHLITDTRLYVDKIINIGNSRDKRVSCVGLLWEGVTCPTIPAVSRCYLINHNV